MKIDRNARLGLAGRHELVESVIAAIRDGEQPQPYDGLGSCYIEFGGGRVGRVDVDFLSGPKPTGTYWAPSTGSLPRSSISARAAAPAGSEPQRHRLSALRAGLDAR